MKDGNDIHHHGTASCSQLKRAVRDAALEAFRGKEISSDFYVICVTSFRKKFLDTDNLCPKWFIDALRYAKIIHGDEAETAQIFCFQEKVRDAELERTEIEITKIHE